MSTMSVCQSCNAITDGVIFHLACECSQNVCNFGTMYPKNWERILLILLWNLQDEDRLVFMLGGPNSDVQSSLSDKDYYNFLSISARFIKSLFSWTLCNFDRTAQRFTRLYMTAVDNVYNVALSQFDSHISSFFINIHRFLLESVLFIFWCCFVYRGSYTSGHFIWNLWNEPSASFIDFIEGSFHKFHMKWQRV